MGHSSTTLLSWHKQNFVVTIYIYIYIYNWLIPNWFGWNYIPTHRETRPNRRTTMNTNLQDWFLVCAQPVRAALLCYDVSPWWRHQMETFSALLALCAGNSSVPGEFPAQRPVTLSFDVFFDVRPNKRLSKESRGWWFERPSRPLWRHHNALAGRKPRISPEFRRLGTYRVARINNEMHYRTVNHN